LPEKIFILSATGENNFIPPMTKQSLDKHWGSGNKSDHSIQYAKLTKEQYADRALELARSKTNETILGYIAENGSIVRYDIINNDWVRAYNTGPATLFKPVRGIDYFFENMAEDGGRIDV